MGHLTRIANMVVHNLEKGPVQAQITDLIKGSLKGARVSWEDICWLAGGDYPHLFRTSRRLQGALGELCGGDPNRDQPEEHGRAGERPSVFFPSPSFHFLHVSASFQKLEWVGKKRR